MTTIGLDERKTELACRILDETNEKIVDQLFAYFVKMKKANTSIEKISDMPYTDEEKLADTEQAMEEVRNGHTITHEEFVKKHAAWW